MNADLVVNAVAGIGECTEAELPQRLEDLATSLGYKHAAIVHATRKGSRWELGETVCHSPEFSRACGAVVEQICASRDPVSMFSIGESGDMTMSVRETRTFAAAGVHLEQLCTSSEKTILLLVSDDRDVALSDVEVRLLSTVGTLVCRALAGKKERHANAQAQDQIGMVSHDLRNPLGNILNYANMLLEPDGPTGSDQQRALEAIRRNSLFMMHLIRDLLDSASIEDGRMRLTMSRCDLRTLLAESVARHEALAQAKGIAIRTETAPAPIEVRVDASKIAQVIDNLISNAIKFSNSGTTVVVSLERYAGQVVLRVKDEGLGIEPSEIGGLFRKFSSTTTRPTQGEKSTGLGLYIVSQMVTMHGGTVSVDSTPRVGTTFTVRLPDRT